MHVCIWVLFLMLLQNTLQHQQFYHLAKRKQRFICFPKITNIWRSCTWVPWEMWVGPPLSSLFSVPAPKSRHVAWWNRKMGGVGSKRKTMSDIKRSVSFFQSACGMSTKTAHLFSLCPVPFISLYSSCSFLVLILPLFFLPLPPNRWNQKIRKRDVKINKHFSCFLSFATVTKGCFCLICFCFSF